MMRREAEIRSAASAIFARERLAPLVLGGPFAALLFAVLWGKLNEHFPDTWPVGMILAGFFTGILVRLVGRGTRPIFYATSLFLYFATILFAIGLFGVMSYAYVSTKLLIVVGGIGISASVALVSFGFRREERWALRDNRGFSQPEAPRGAFSGTAVPVAALLGACGLAILSGVALDAGFSGEDVEEGPIFGEPSVDYWERALEREPELAEEARRNGVGLGLDGSDEACRIAVRDRHADCDLNLCKAQRPYVLAGCLETAKAVREDTPIRW